MQQHVSIHAPQWGATASARAFPSLSSVFQFTHPSGVRPRSKTTSTASPAFQFTHPSGVRRELRLPKDYSPEFQFTHPSGVRQVGGLNLSQRVWFQFTHPSGVRLCRVSQHVCVAWFQFTHPSGVRRREDYDSYTPRGFNSRTPVGCDLVGVSCYMLELVSIHAPQWGATGVV